RDEIVEQLEDAPLVRLDDNRAAAEERKRELLRLRSRTRFLDSLPRNTAEVEFGRREYERTGLELCHEQQIVDQAEEPLRAARDDLEVGASLLVELRLDVLVQRQLHVAHDRRERRA